MSMVIKKDYILNINTVKNTKGLYRSHAVRCAVKTPDGGAYLLMVPRFSKVGDELELHYVSDLDNPFLQHVNGYRNIGMNVLGIPDAPIYPDIVNYLKSLNMVVTKDDMI